MREEDFIEALLCGFLIALTSALIVEYFGVADVGMFMGLAAGLIVINVILLLLVGWPFRLGGVVAIFVVTLILGYAAYGPYATYIREPMREMGESMKEFPILMEKQLHCLALIFTNPMAYQQECVLTDQEKVPEPGPSDDVGLEIVQFEVQPEGEIYAGMPFQIWMTLDNMGDYDAENLIIITDGGEYEQCILEVLNISQDSIDGGVEDKLLPRRDHYYGVRGTINDPWETSCTYAKNKMIIGGVISTDYYYDYQTESYLEIEVIKNVDEVKPKFQVNSAKEKAAPANVLMYTFSPLIWENVGESFRQGIIPLSFKNERIGGSISFRGEYISNSVVLPESEINTLGWCEATCSEKMKGDAFCETDCISSFEEEKKTYHHCAVMLNGKEIYVLEGLKEDECKNTEIKNLGSDASKNWCLAETTIETSSGGGAETSSEAAPYCNGFSGSYTYQNSLFGEVTVDCSTCKFISLEGTCDCGPVGTTGVESEFISKQVLSEKCEYSAPETSEESDSKETETDRKTFEVGEGIPCDALTTESAYRVYGKYARDRYDTIKIYIVGDDVAGKVNLGCGDSSKDDLVKCTGGGNSVELSWINNDVSLGPGETKFIYSGVTVSLGSGSWPNADGIDFNFGIKSDATYRVEMSSSESLRINNPHYTSR